LWPWNSHAAGRMAVGSMPRQVVSLKCIQRIGANGARGLRACSDPLRPRSLGAAACSQQPRNTRYQADATPYLGRTCTGWTAPALRLAHLFDHLVGEGEQRRRHLDAGHVAVSRFTTRLNLLAGAPADRRAWRPSGCDRHRPLTAGDAQWLAPPDVKICHCADSFGHFVGAGTQALDIRFEGVTGLN
jgi:hypothetical protein